jgi:hypothetical protein
MKIFAFLFGFVFGTSVFASQVAYQNLPASKKLQYLTQKVQAQPYEELPGLNLQLSFGNLLDVTETMLFLSKSFDHTSDEMPEGRAKIIHPLGVTAPVVWRPSANAYTGIFQTGGVGLGAGWTDHRPGCGGWGSHPERSSQCLDWDESPGEGCCGGVRLGRDAQAILSRDDQDSCRSHTKGWFCFREGSARR